MKIVHLFALTVLATSASAQGGGMPFRITDAQVFAMLQNMPPESARSIGTLINGLLSDTTSHMKMADRRPASHADSARATAVVAAMHSSLDQYADVTAAERDGFVKFLPWLDDQIVYHYNNTSNQRLAAKTFDATRPTSLLYRKDAQGKMVLVGAMYTAPATATPEELQARLPLGIAYWHQHVSFCARAPTPAELKSQVPDSARVAHSLQLDTPEKCATENGIFIPQLFGWMAHINAFAGTDMETVWGEEGRDHMTATGHSHH